MRGFDEFWRALKRKGGPRVVSPLSREEEEIVIEYVTQEGRGWRIVEVDWSLSKL